MSLSRNPGPFSFNDLVRFGFAFPRPAGGKPPARLLNFLSMINAHTGSGCLLWNGQINRGGYGCLASGGKRIRKVHRMALILATEMVPDASLYACHKCDVKNCFNPNHLFWGTAKDNSSDAAAKGRHGRRIGWHGSKLSAEQILKIRELNNSGMRITAISREMNIPQTTVHAIARGNRWRNVTTLTLNHP